MTRKLVTEAGYYNGEFLKPGQHFDDGAGDINLEKMTKEELLAEAEARNVSSVTASNTKAEIIAAIEASGTN
jgi:hypothetical protein